MAKDELDLVGVAEPELVFGLVGAPGVSMEEVVAWVVHGLNLLSRRMPLVLLSLR